MSVEKSIPYQHFLRIIKEFIGVPSYSQIYHQSPSDFYLFVSELAESYTNKVH